MGYTSGDPFGGIDLDPRKLGANYIDFDNFSNFYIGFQVGMYDRIYQSKDLKHNK